MVATDIVAGLLLTAQLQAEARSTLLVGHHHSPGRPSLWEARDRRNLPSSAVACSGTAPPLPFRHSSGEPQPEVPDVPEVPAVPEVPDVPEEPMRWTPEGGWAEPGQLPAAKEQGNSAAAAAAAAAASAAAVTTTSTTTAEKTGTQQLVRRELTVEPDETVRNAL